MRADAESSGLLLATIGHPSFKVQDFLIGKIPKQKCFKVEIFYFMLQVFCP